MLRREYSATMVYKPDAEREESRPIDKQRVALVVCIGVVAVLAWAGIVYGILLFLRAIGGAVGSSGG
jgi:hypothetical protein